MRNLGLVQQALSMKRCYNTNAKKNCIHKIVKQLSQGQKILKKKIVQLNIKNYFGHQI